MCLFQRAASRSAVDDVRLVSNEIRTYTPPRKVSTHFGALARALPLSFCVSLSPSPLATPSLHLLSFYLIHSLTLSLARSLAQSLPLFHSNSVSLTACRKESQEVSSVVSLSLSRPTGSYPRSLAHQTKVFSAPLSSRSVASQP